MEQNNSNPNQGSQSAPSATNNPQATSGTPASAPTNNQNQQKQNQQQPKPMNTNNQQKPNQPKKASSGSNTTLWWIIAAIIVIVVIVVATKHKPAPQPTPAAPTESETEGSQSAPAAIDSSESSSFADAIKSYTGKAVILGLNEKKECIGLPEKLAVAAGTRVLVANNSAQPLSVEVADKKVDLDAYHYFTVSLGDALQYSVMCEGQAAAVSSIEIK